MLDENINVQVDEERNKYLENTRSYLMQKLNITKKTIQR